MSSLAPTVAGALLGSVLLLVVFGIIYAKGRERHVLFWSGAWLASGVRYVVTLLNLHYDTGPLGDIVFDLAVLASSFLLAIGASIFIGRSLPRFWLWLAAPVFVWMIAVDYTELPFVFEHGPTFFLNGVMVIWTGAIILRSDEPPGVGKSLTGWTLVVWGTHRLDFPFVADDPTLAIWGFMLAQVLELTVSIGILILYFERAKREAQSLEARLVQSQKMEALGRVAGGVAHDFNNLLTVVRGNAELLSSELPEGSSAGELVAAINGAAERAAGLTRQLLAFSRRQVLRPQVVDLRPMVESTSQMLRRLIGEHIQLEVSLPEEACLVRCDPDQFTQVLMNLAINARDAMPRGGRLGIALACEGPSVRLEVSDTGAGIPPEVLPHIFEPFYTTKEIGKGTGLGLAMVYGIVEQSGGHIEVESSGEAGTTFLVHLPFVEQELQQPVAPRAPIRPARGSTILLVEDEPSLREMVERILERAGHQVILAESSPHALRLAREGGRFDLVLTDVVMPEMSGPELAARLSEHDPSLPVLFMSGYPDRIDQEGTLDPDAPFLAKPFTPDGLIEAVRRVLDGKPRAGRKAAPPPVTPERS